MCKRKQVKQSILSDTTESAQRTDKQDFLQSWMH